MSGQLPSLTKPSMALSKNASRDLKRSLSSRTGIHFSNQNITYLGNPLFIQNIKTRDFNFILDKISQQADGWRVKFLSNPRKAILTKSALQWLSVYTRSTFKIPIFSCNKIDSLIRQFWWNSKENSKRFLAFRSWEEICLPKDFGGLGYRYFHNLNLALLSKLGWNLATQTDKIWFSILLSKYCQTSNLMNAISKPGDSFVWKGICKLKELLKLEISYQIGNGESINLSTEPWIPPYIKSFKPMPSQNGSI